MRDTRRVSYFCFPFSNSSLFQFGRRHYQKGSLAPCDSFPIINTIILTIAISVVLLRASFALNPYAVFYFSRDVSSARLIRRCPLVVQDIGSSLPPVFALPTLQVALLPVSTSQLGLFNSSNSLLSNSNTNLLLLRLFIPCARPLPLAPLM